MLRKKLSVATPVPQEKPSLNAEDKSTGDLLHSAPQQSPSGSSSRYFLNMNQAPMNRFVNQVLEIQRALNNSLSQVNFLKPPIEYMYNPTQYAKIPNELYLNKYCQSEKKLLFVGMNPGPFGMCQTGVPFGDTYWVKNWLRIEGPVSKPLIECPRRIIHGFDCPTKEQSGDRFWKFWSDQCGNPEIFFEKAFVYNYCPLAFMDKIGKNVTPADIKDCKELESICDASYLELINLLQPEVIVAIGRYIQKRTEKVVKDEIFNVQILYMPHPSPRSPNNNNWQEKAKTFTETHNLMRFFH